MGFAVLWRLPAIAAQDTRAVCALIRSPLVLSCRPAGGLQPFGSYTTFRQSSSRLQQLRLFAAGSGMEASSVPTLKDVVLLGGGHSHVEVLRSFGMKPLPGVRLTLITKDIHTAYSGMLPGFVAGFYNFDECHIDLATLACFAGARMIHAEAQGIDARAQSIQFDDRPSVRYDVLSIDVGITPSTQGVPGVMEHAIPVKPVSNFVVRLQKLRQDMQKLDRPIKVAVVGGGAGGVELSLAVHTALQTQRASESPVNQHPVHAGIYTRGRVLATYPAAVRNAFLRAFQRKGMQLHEDAHVTELKHRQLYLEGQEPHKFDACLWCTQASAPSWLKTSSHGLPLDDQGFVRVNDNLQCDGGPANVFAVGDVSSSVSSPRPKAGVFAVRQGPPLANNLRRLLQGEELQPFTPQSTYLSIITTGERYAVATKSFLCLEVRLRLA